MDDVFEGGKLSEASIYAIGFRGRGRSPGGGYSLNRGFLKRLVRESGGRAFFPTDSNSLNRSYYQIREELHGQYQMAYVPKNTHWDGDWRDIVVRIKGLDHLVVRTRQGYYALPRGESATGQ